MNLSIALASNASYSAGASSLPFIYKVTFDRKTTVVGPIKVSSCLLTHCEDQEVSAGYVRNIFNISKQESLYEEGACITIDVDALEHGGDGDLIAGQYELAAKVSFSVKEVDGTIQGKELRASTRVELN